MFFQTMNYKSKRFRVLLIQIVLAFAMFIFLINLNSISNFCNCINKIFYGPEEISFEIMSFTKVSMLEHFLSISIGCVLLETSKFIIFTIALIALVVYLAKENIIIFKREYNYSEKSIKIPSKHIYLLTSKFIC